MLARCRCRRRCTRAHTHTRTGKRTGLNHSALPDKAPRTDWLRSGGHDLRDNHWLISIGRPRSLTRRPQIETERVFTRPRGPVFPQRRYDKTSQQLTSQRHAQIKFSRDNTAREEGEGGGGGCGLISAQCPPLAQNASGLQTWYMARE